MPSPSRAESLAAKPWPISCCSRLSVDGNAAGDGEMRHHLPQQFQDASAPGRPP